MIAWKNSVHFFHGSQIKEVNNCIDTQLVQRIFMGFTIVYDRFCEIENAILF